MIIVLIGIQFTLFTLVSGGHYEGSNKTPIKTPNQLNKNKKANQTKVQLAFTATSLRFTVYGLRTQHLNAAKSIRRFNKTK
ncbi:hypothetical protein C9J43_16250 [Photobacterium sp. GB-3]|nr:hypothetical protein C9J43_16250 [Photobacterium sp. GB-3]